jgi:phosphonate transport system substrate-binding protein
MNQTTHKLRVGRELCASLALWLGVFCVPVTQGGGVVPVETDTNHVFRLAFSATMFTEVNENDARAAMKVWIMTVAKDRGIPVDPDPHICRTLDELTEVCRTNHVDGVGLVAAEYARLSQTIKFDRLGVGDYDGRIMEEYVVLVRQDSGVEHLDQLQGHTLNILNTPRTSLAPIWLDTILLEARLKDSADFFKQISYDNKAALVILPVFFHRADACLMTLDSFKIMGELNPQLAKQLRVIATSPKMLPACFAFRAAEGSAMRPRILTEMAQMNETPAGKQILTLVKADRIVEEPITCLDSALELLAKHERLCGGKAEAKGIAK